MWKWVKTPVLPILFHLQIRLSIGCIMARKLLKKETTVISRNLKDYCTNNFDRICEKIEKSISEQAHAKYDSKRQEILKCFMDKKTLIKKLLEKYCNLYTECHTGRFADRFAKLSIKWTYHSSQFLVQGSDEKEEIKVFFDQFGSNDISSVLHALTTSISEQLNVYIQKCMPKSKEKSPVKNYKPSEQEESKSHVLAFGGACMRQIYKFAKKKGNAELQLLIKNLILTKNQCKKYKGKGKNDLNIIGENSCLHSLHYIPVPALFPYLKCLNLAIRDGCQDSSLSLYKNKFIKVSEMTLFITQSV